MRRFPAVVLALIALVVLAGWAGGGGTGPAASTAGPGRLAFAATADAGPARLPLAVPAALLNAIDAHYQELGGASSFLGTPLGPEYPVAGGAARDYQGGSIYWSAATGAHESHGAIRGEYLARGGPGGLLGFPLTDEMSTPGAAGRFNVFAHGSVYWSASTGAHEVHGAIGGLYVGLGGPASFLGFPLTDETAISGVAGRYSTFAGGTIYWSASTGPKEVHGAIRAHYLALGGPGGFLGLPFTNEFPTGGAGRSNVFAHGSIIWSPGTGAHEVHGAIRDLYLAFDAADGFLGFPVTDETATPDGLGRYNHFSGTGGASIYWSPATGAHEVLGGIRATWARLGWEHGRLGYPVSGEYSIAGGRRSDFQHGSILWNAATGTVQVVYAPLPASLRGVDLERIPTAHKVVALTFDAGANDAALRPILNTLAANGVPGTFFLTGTWANQFRADVSAIVAAGHTVGNHSLTHPEFTTLTDAQIAAEIGGAQSAILAAGADPRPFFRFPFGNRDARTIADVNAAGYAAVRWTVDTLGWQGTMGGTRGPDFVVDRVMAAAQPGEIVLMHLGSNPDDGSTLDAAALPTVIAQLRAAGYGFVTLDAALG